MKKIILWVVVAALAIALMVGITALYNYLGENIDREVPEITLPQISSPESDSEGSSESESEGEAPDTSTPDSETEGVESEEPETNEPDTNEPDTNEPDTNEPETNEPETEESVVEFHAPDVTFYDENGNEVSLSSFAGKPIVLNFWASWCPPCVAEMPDFDEMYKKYPEVQFVMLNATLAEEGGMITAKNHVDREGYEFPVFYDLTGSGLGAYGITHFPTTVLITSNGYMVYNKSGMLSASQLEGVIKQLIAIE